MRVYLLLWLSIFYIYSFSQTPTTPPLINYQGIARNAAGMPITNVTNPSISIRFEIYATLNGGTAAFSELQQNIPVSNLGLFSTQIGKNTGNFGTVNWATGTWYLEVYIDINNSANPTASLGRQQLVSVPYALYAEKAGSAPAPSVSYTNNILNVGGNTATITGNNYTAGNGIDISNGVISNTAVPSITLTGTGLATVSPSVSSIFNINVPIQNYTTTGNMVSSNLGGSFTIPTSSTSIPPTITGVNNATVTSGVNTYTVDVLPQVLNILGTNTITLSNGGGSIVVPTTSYTQGQNISIVSNTISSPSYSIGFTSPTTGTINNGLGVSSFTVPSPVLTGSNGITISGTWPNQTISAVTPTTSWNITGNAGTNSGTNFLGTTDNTNLSIRTNNLTQATFSTNGFFGIGTLSPNSKLDVLGSAGDIVRFANFGTTNTNAVLNVNNAGTNGGTGINVTHTTGVGINVNTSGPGNLINITTTGGGIGLNASAGGNNAVNAINSGANPAINANNGGTGGAITAQSSGSVTTISAINSSSGNAIGASNNSNIAPTLLVTNSGNHNAINASNNSNLQPTLLLSNTNAGGAVMQASQTSSNTTANFYNFGTGDIIYANKNNPATGRVAFFTNTNTGNASPVIDVQNQGSGPAVNLFSGATSAIALQISDGHIKSSGGSPMLGTYNFSGFIGGSVGFGGSITGTDIKGNISFYTPAGYTGINAGAYISQTVNFNKNFTTPPTVILTPISDLQGLSFMVFNTTISSFEVRVYRSNNGAVGPTSGPLNTLLKFNYFVIE